MLSFDFSFVHDLLDLSMVSEREDGHGFSYVYYKITIIANFPQFLPWYPLEVNCLTFISALMLIQIL